jgi:hypothetical protein
LGVARAVGADEGQIFDQSHAGRRQEQRFAVGPAERAGQHHAAWKVDDLFQRPVRRDIEQPAIAAAAPDAAGRVQADAVDMAAGQFADDPPVAE